MSVSLPESLTAQLERTAAAQTLPHGALGLAVRPDATGTVFFLVASDARTSAEVEELAKAFVGPTFARRRLPASYLQAGEKLSEHLERLADSGKIVALLAPSGYESSCGNAIARLFEVRSRRPVTATLTPRGLAVILRDFEDAVAREDVSSASALVAEAESTGRLNLTNKSRLQVRVLACARAWSEVIDYTERLRLADLHLPGPVQNDVVRSAFVSVLAEALDAGVQVAVEAFEGKLEPRVGGAFRDHRTATSREARLAWMIRFAARGELVPNAAVEELLARAGPEEQGDLQRIAEYANPEARTSEQDVRELLEEGEDASAWAVTQGAGDLPAAFREDALRRAATRLEDPIRLAQAEVVASTDSGVDVDPSAARTAHVDGWHDWLQALYDDPEWPQAGAVLEAHADAWNEQFVSGTNDFAGLAGLIEALSGEPSFVAATPRLARAVLPSGPDGDVRARERQPILKALAYAIAKMPGPGSADLDTLSDVAGAIIRGGIDGGAYEVLTAQLRDIYLGLSAPPLLARWVLDVIAMLLTHPTPSDRAREEAIRQLLGPLLTDAQRARPLVRREVWEELQELLEGHWDLVDVIETVQRAVVHGDDDADALSVLDGKTVLLLTLIDQAGARASAHLSAAIPRVKVLTDNSSVASDRLKEHARRADLVVVASRACKHAAYDCVQAAASDRIVYASGKGWSSLVGAVHDNIGKLA